MPVATVSKGNKLATRTTVSEDSFPRIKFQRGQYNINGGEGWEEPQKKRVSKELTEGWTYIITYTRNKTGYFVRPESSILGGRSSMTFNSITFVRR